MRRSLSKAIFCLLLGSFAFGGCATEYVRKSEMHNGYSDRVLSSGSYVVTFQASETTPAEQVKVYALKRAAEVALQNGYRYFEIQKTVEPRRMGKAKEGIRYPSIRLYIQCYAERPSSQAYSAEELLR